MLLCFSSSHRNADFDLLERLERHSSNVTAALNGRPELINGSVVLATCNRFEAYLDVDEPLTAALAVSVEAVLDSICRAADVDPAELRTSSSVFCDNAVAEHLFAVSSGLESVVVGEGEIAGQVRRALQTARSAGTVTRELERLFQVASRTSRGVKNRTGITTAGRSIVRLALDLSESRITDWSATHVLLVGTGAYAGATLAALRERGVTDVRVFSPSGRAGKFSTSHGITAISASELVGALGECDVVITCSVAPDVILDVDTMSSASALDGASERQLVIDLGLPRNVQPSVAEIDRIELLDLETISKHAPLAELAAATEARAIVDEAAAEFSAAASEFEATPALIALRKHVFDVLDAEIERARQRGDSTDQTEAALRHLAGVLLHTPSVRAKALARAGDAASFAASVELLFGVDVDSTDSAAVIEGAGSTSEAGRLRALRSESAAS